MKAELGQSASWPEIFGFKIYGNGPSYVTSIFQEGDSLAVSSNLSLGDHLVELNGIDVSNASADVIRSIARQSKAFPPSLVVQPGAVYTELLPQPPTGFGFVTRQDDEAGMVIDDVLHNGAAHKAGLLPGRNPIFKN